MRRAPLLSAAVVLTGLLLAVPVPGAEAARSTLPGTIGTGTEISSTTTVIVPSGVTPTALTGVLSMDRVAAGTSISVLVNGRVALTVPTRLYARVRVPVTPADLLSDRSLVLTVRTVDTNATGVAATCPSTAPVAATLRKIGLAYTGTETAPTTVGEFFSDSVSRVDVVVPATAGDDLLAAGLNAVASLSSRYPDGVSVGLSSAADPLPAATAGSRVVVLTAGGSSVTTAITPGSGVPTLTLAGSGDTLAAATSALGADAMMLANSRTTRDLSRLPAATRDVGAQRSLEDLGAERIELATPSPPTSTFRISQDAFGGEVSKLDLHLVGTHTALPSGVNAQLGVYLDGLLVDSVPLDEDPTLDADVSLPAALLAADNQVTLALGGGPGCLTGQAPLQVDIDGVRSGLTATVGSGETVGFQRFPQVLQGNLAVALRPKGATRLASAIDAAYLVSTLQRGAAAPLRVELVDADQFLADRDSGLFVGADSDDAVALQAPLPLTSTRSVDGIHSSFEVGSDQPFATLEALHQEDRDVLLLGSWSANGPRQSSPGLSRKAATLISNGGWDQLGDDVYVVDAQSNGASLRTTSPASQTGQGGAGDGNGLAKWFVIAIAVLLLLMLVQVLTSMRRRRTRTGATPAGPVDRNSDDPLI